MGIGLGGFPLMGVPCDSLLKCPGGANFGATGGSERARSLTSKDGQKKIFEVFYELLEPLGSFC